MTKFIPLLLAALTLFAGTGNQAVRAQPVPAGTIRNAETHAPHFPSAADMAAQHRQFCQDTYAHTVGDLAYLEARLNLTRQQQPLFDRWKNVKLNIAKHGAADCATLELPRPQNKPPTLLDAMTSERENLKRRLADLDTEMPLFTAFYNDLAQPQKDALDHPDEAAMLVRRHGFIAAMAARRDHGPGGAPGTPPPPQ